MRIGILADIPSENEGGGHIFVVELLRGLLDGRDHTSHQLIVFSIETSSTFRERHPDICFVNLTGERHAVSTLQEKLLSAPRVVAKIVWPFIKAWRYLISGGEPVPSVIQRVLDKYQIEFLLVLNPWGESSYDVPYGVFLWDLQHRKHPFFPEVCNRGVWSKRESFYREFLQRAAIVFACNHTAKAEIEFYYQVAPERIVLTPHPTASFALDAADAAMSGELGGTSLLPLAFEDFIFYPAQFWSHKNHIAILEACHLIKAQHSWCPNVIFTGTDKGNLAYIEQCIQELGLADKVRILGFVARDQLIQLYRAAWCLCFPSFFGPENLPPLEAMALGCPVLCAAYDGAAEQLGDAALFFNPQNPEDLAAQLLKLHEDDSLRCNLIKRGRTRAQRYTVRNFVCDVYTALDGFSQIRRAWGQPGARIDH